MMGFEGLRRMAHALEDEIEILDIGAPEVATLLRGVDAFRHRLAAVTADDAGLQEPTETQAPVAETGDATIDPEAIGSFAGSRDGSVRIPFTRIDQLVEMLAETSIVRNRLGEAIDAGLSTTHEAGKDLAELVLDNRAAWDQVDAARQALDKTLDALQEYVTDLGMVPLRLLFRSLQRLVHDEARRTDKEVELVTAGGDTPIDKTLLEVAGEALGHLVRNAVIHGIELPEARRQAGKAGTGTIKLSASVEGSEVRIEVRDNGAGIDLDAVRALAPPIADRGVDLEPTGEEAVYALLFEQGVSTHREADLGAGRGVGLTAVKRSVDRHNGRIEVRSTPGRGSSFALRLPLTASILRSLLLSVDGETYALPLVAVSETLHLTPERIHEINGAAVLRWRKRLTPLLDVGMAFGTASAPRHTGLAIIIDMAGRERGLAVDDIAGIRDIVIKGLDPIVGQPVGISGTTILGDGRVVMLLDPASLSTIPPSPIRAS